MQATNVWAEACSYMFLAMLRSEGDLAIFLKVCVQVCVDVRENIEWSRANSSPVSIFFAGTQSRSTPAQRLCYGLEYLRFLSLSTVLLIADTYRMQTEEIWQFCSLIYPSHCAATACSPLIEVSLMNTFPVRCKLSLSVRKCF